MNSQFVSLRSFQAVRQVQIDENVDLRFRLGNEQSLPDRNKFVSPLINSNEFVVRYQESTVLSPIFAIHHFNGDVLLQLQNVQNVSSLF